MTKRLIILLVILALIITYYFFNNHSEEIKSISSKNLTNNQLKESHSIDGTNGFELETEDKRTVFNHYKTESSSIPLSTAVSDLEKEEKMIEESIEEYAYMVENDLLNEDEDDVVPVAVMDENENRSYDDEDDFIDVDSKELEASIHAYNEK